VRRDRILYFGLVIAASGFALLASSSPYKFLTAGLLAIGAAFVTLAYLFPAMFLAVVILTIGLSPEYLLERGFGLDLNEIRTLLRVMLLLAFGVNIWRNGLVWRSNPPIAALLLMFLVTVLAADFLPNLTWIQMAKSLVGLMLPFMFLHCVYRREAIDRYLDMVAIIPLICIAVGILAAVIGLRPLFKAEYTGAMRLQGMSIAAYLAFNAFAAFFICCYQILRAPRRRYYLIAGINLLIILMTGTRMPMLMAAIVGVAVMLFAPQQSLRWSVRIKLAYAGAVLLAGALFVLWPSLEARLTGTSGGGTSGRTFIWAYYMTEIEKSPWFGRGIGSGVVLLPEDDYHVDYTNAAHNEYLRILMDSGIVGLAIFVVAMIWWVRMECRFMLKDERVLFIAFMVAYAIATFTDNTLSSPPTLVIYFTLALIIYRARQRARELVPAPLVTESMVSRRPFSPPRPI
jgi:O-antigen ligase